VEGKNLDDVTGRDAYEADEWDPIEVVGALDDWSDPSMLTILQPANEMDFKQKSRLAPSLLRSFYCEGVEWRGVRIDSYRLDKRFF
jgi:hypothetical protein